MSYFLTKLIVVYKYFFSPWLGNNCRFVPTCSEYAMQALEKHGVAKGSWISFLRLCRCHPLCKGGYDPVP